MPLSPLSSRRLRFLTLAVALLALFAISLPTNSNLLAQGRERSTARPTAVRLSNQWAVQIAPGADANAIAAQAGFVNAGVISGNTYLFIAQGTDAFASSRTETLRAFAGVLNAQQQEILPLANRVPTDPLIGDQWHLNNTAQETGMVAGEDANVFPAWDLGFDGTGLVVASVDDGLWFDNPDLTPNYRADLSFDFFEGDADPRGGAHGTSVGGIMAGADDGVTCGVGAAYNAGLAGIVYTFTDAGDSAALQYGLTEIDVYNQSWGPQDDGETFLAPGPLTNAALQKGITEGRNGKGAIYVWAAGNGKQADDNVNADGWANDRRVIAVGASDFTGESAYYSEPGAPMLVNAPSSGNTGGNSYGTTTTDVPGAGGYSAGNCTNSFGGTSSAAPLTSGVVALMLQANPDLTWRDVQAVLVDSADINDPSHFDWQTNDAGLQFNHYYGFGRVNAEQAVTTAQGWTNLPPEIKAETQFLTVNAPIPTDASMPLTTVINMPHDIVVEHVEIIVNATHTYRGDVSINLESPHGTVSRMLEGRDNDGGANLSNWRMSTVANWGEMSSGQWKLHIWDDFAAEDNGTLTSWKLIVYGHSAGGEPQELLVNGGFENELEPAWSLKDPIGDKIKTNKEGKTFARSGESAFRFKGNEGAAGKLVQKIEGAPLASLLPGDWVTFVGFYNATTLPDKLGTVKIKYPDDTKTKLELLPESASGAYEVVGANAMLEATPVNIKVILKYEGTSGKVYLDDLSLFTGLSSRDVNTLSLPGSEASGSSSTNDVLPLP
jgi:subtilisin-like proprotein convertase family protein